MAPIKMCSLVIESHIGRAIEDEHEPVPILRRDRAARVESELSNEDTILMCLDRVAGLYES